MTNRQTNLDRCGRPIRLLGVALAIALFATVLFGCDAPPPVSEAPSPRSAPVPPGDVVPMLPRSIAQRPIDLALFDKDEIRQHVIVSTDDYPNGRGDIPWLLGEPGQHFSSAEFLNPSVASQRFDWRESPYWCAVLPATVTVNLRQPSYLSEIVVRPLFGWGAGFRFHASLLLEDGTRIETIPPAADVISKPEDIRKSAHGVPFVARFHPKLAHKVEITFEAVTNGPNRAYIAGMRILGHPADAPHADLHPATADERVRLVNESSDVARLTDKEAQVVLRVSEDRAPNGSAATPWLGAEASGASDTPYWCAAAPAWLEIRLPVPAIIHRVLVQPYTEKYGVAAFYAKVVTPEGVELDTYPPIEASRIAEPAAEGDRKIPPLIADFEPVHVDRLKFYFTQPGAVSDLLYIEDIRIFGIPIAE